MNRKLSEPEIYVLSKRMLQRNNWILLGGEPPDGTDVIPRIELRDPENRGRGSKGSKKIDLLAFKSGKILLLELKRFYSQSDIIKLNEIVTKEKWRRSLLLALRGKRAFIRQNINNVPDFVNEPKHLVKSIGLSERHRLPQDFLLFVIREDEYETHFGQNCSISRSFFIS